MNLKRFFYLVIIVSFLLLFFSLTSYAFAGQSGQSANSLFQQANNLYGNGKYRQAQQIYSRIAAKDGVSGPLLYNLANCYAQLDQPGLAILNYERALRLSPGDSDIRGNLDLIRKNKGLFQDEPSWETRFASFLDLDQWTLLAGMLFVVFTLICLAGLRFKNGKHLRLWLGGFCLIFILAAGAGAAFQYRKLNNAVIISDDARLLLSPFTKAASIGTLREGRIVRYIAKHGNFSLIEDQAGRNGWMKSTAIELIGRMN
jgi:tetratricopeptide (TPR) repeat protein